MIEHVKRPFGFNALSIDLIIALALFAALAWVVRRRIISAKETAVIGIAAGFFCVSLVYKEVLKAVVIYFPHQLPKALATSALLVIPLALAISYGVWVLYKSRRE